MSNPTSVHNEPDEELGLSTPPIPALCGMPLKLISLVTLAFQNSLLTLVMHYSRVSTPPSRTYLAATAVLVNEILKGLISFVIAFWRTEIPSYLPDGSQSASLHWSLRPRVYLFRLRKLYRDIFSPDCWKLSIPAILYVIQNNLQYIAASNLDAATFQVTYQMKLLTTAGFSVLLLRRKLSSNQWLALLFLAIGVGIVQIQASDPRSIPTIAANASSDIHTMNGLKGLMAVVAACFTSGLAGVYFEKVLKNSQADLWIRNVQLSLFSLLPAFAPVLLTAHALPQAFGPSACLSVLFQNFGPWAWITVAVQVSGGLLTAMVIKYSDNILKGFATSLSIVISFLASIALFDFPMTSTFILGSMTVLFATWLYNQPPKHPGSIYPESVLLTLTRPEKHRSNLQRSPTPTSLSLPRATLSTSSLSSLSSVSSAPPLFHSMNEKYIYIR